jgi:hypothetical protein
MTGRRRILDLGVSASLGGCGLAETQIVCRIDASWSSAEGADYYTVSVTRPDGSVVDLGQSTGTSRSIYVPYVGPGSYSIEVAAWGTPPDEDDPEVIVREDALSTGSQTLRESARGAQRVSAPGGGRSTDEAAEQAASEPPAAVPAPAGEERPVCYPDPVDEQPADDATDPAPLAAGEPAPAPEAAAEESEPDPAEPVACP